jgi:hypothetical protein
MGTRVKRTRGNFIIDRIDISGFNEPLVIDEKGKIRDWRQLKPMLQKQGDRMRDLAKQAGEAEREQLSQGISHPLSPSNWGWWPDLYQPSDSIDQEDS